MRRKKNSQKSKKAKKKSEKRYPSDISTRSWKILRDLIPAAKFGGRPRTVSMRGVINGLRYVLRSGCQWRMLPKSYPAWETVYGYKWRWERDGTWEQINTRLVKKVRRKAGRKIRPSAGSVDSQSVKTHSRSKKKKGYDGGKKVSGRKRFILTDTMGLILSVVVVAANVSENAGLKKLVRRVLKVPVLKDLVSRLKKVWLDAGYRGVEFFAGLSGRIARKFRRKKGWDFEVVKRKEGEIGFVLLARRWVAERTFSWLFNFRRLSKDYEKKARSAQAFIYLANINIMLNRL